MSGGLFNYQQFRIRDITESLEEIIDTEKQSHEYSKETMDEFVNGLAYLKAAYIYAQRIDWLVSGDDGEDSFHQRLKEELEKM